MSCRGDQTRTSCPQSRTRMPRRGKYRMGNVYMPILRATLRKWRLKSNTLRVINDNYREDTETN